MPSWRAHSTALTTSCATLQNTIASGEELVRLYVASQAGKLILRRLKVDASTLSDANILHHAELSVYFGQFVSGRARMYRGANNRAQVA